MKKITILLSVFISGCANPDGSWRLPRFEPSAESMQLMGIGAGLYNQSQPRPIGLYQPTHSTCWQSGIYTNCNQY